MQDIILIHLLFLNSILVFSIMFVSWKPAKNIKYLKICKFCKSINKKILLWGIFVILNCYPIMHMIYVPLTYLVVVYVSCSLYSKVMQLQKAVLILNWINTISAKVINFIVKKLLISDPTEIVNKNFKCFFKGVTVIIFFPYLRSIMQLLTIIYILSISLTLLLWCRERNVVFKINIVIFFFQVVFQMYTGHKATTTIKFFINSIKNSREKKLEILWIVVFPIIVWIFLFSFTWFYGNYLWFKNFMSLIVIFFSLSTMSRLIVHLILLVIVNQSITNQKVIFWYFWASYYAKIDAKITTLFIYNNNCKYLAFSVIDIIENIVPTEFGVRKLYLPKNFKTDVYTIFLKLVENRKW